MIRTSWRQNGLSIKTGIETAEAGEFVRYGILRQNGLSIKTGIETSSGRASCFRWSACQNGLSIKTGIETHRSLRRIGSLSSRPERLIH